MSKRGGRKAPVVEVRSRRPVVASYPASEPPPSSAGTGPVPTPPIEVPASGKELAERLRALQQGQVSWWQWGPDGHTALVQLSVGRGELDSLQQLATMFEGTSPMEVLTHTLAWGARWVRKVGGDDDWAQKRKLAKRYLRSPRNKPGFAWEKIPVQVRREMVADLRQRPFPWLNAHRELAKKHGLTTRCVCSLVQAVALYGFEDPGVMGTDSEEPDAP